MYIKKIYKICIFMSKTNHMKFAKIFLNFQLSTQRIKLLSRFELIFGHFGLSAIAYIISAYSFTLISLNILEMSFAHRLE